MNFRVPETHLAAFDTYRKGRGLSRSMAFARIIEQLVVTNQAAGRVHVLAEKDRLP